MILSFILGMCVMSAFAFIAVCLIDDGKDWSVFLCGSVAWVVITFRSAAESIQCWRRDYNKRSLLLDENNHIHVVPIWAADAFCLVKDWSFPSKFSKDENVQRMAAMFNERKEEWGKEDINMGFVNMRYASRSVWQDFIQVKRKEAKKIFVQSKKL